MYLLVKVVVNWQAGCALNSVVWLLNTCISDIINSLTCCCAGHLPGHRDLPVWLSSSPIAVDPAAWHLLSQMSHLPKYSDLSSGAWNFKWFLCAKFSFVQNDASCFLLRVVFLFAWMVTIPVPSLGAACWHCSSASWKSTCQTLYCCMSVLFAAAAFTLTMCRNLPCG